MAPKPMWAHPLKLCASVFGLLYAMIGLILPAQANITLQPLLGFGQFNGGIAYFRPHSWNPLAVHLIGTAPQGETELQVTVRRGDHQDTYVRKLLFAGGPLDQTETFVLDLSPLQRDAPYNIGAEKQEIRVQLLQNGHSLAGPIAVSLPAPLLDISYNVLVLDSRPAGLHFLENHLFDIAHRGQNLSGLGNMFIGSGTPNAMIDPIILMTDAPNALPSSPQGYAPVDAVVLGNFDLANRISQAQVDALRSFICSGGTLVVAGGPDLSHLQSCPLHDLFPLNPTGIRTVSQLPTLSLRYQTALTINHPIGLTTGPLQPNAKVLLAEPNGLPLVLERPYGNGKVIFTTFDYMDPIFTTWPAAPSLWRDLLLCGNFSVSPTKILANDGTWMGDTNTMDRLLDALANPTVTQLPSLTLIAVFTLGYVFLLVPVNYFVLKHLDRKELAWITTPAIIVLFSIGSYAIGANIHAHVVSFNRVGVLETQAGTNRAYGLAQMALYLPTSDTVSVGLTSPNADPADRLYYPHLMAISDPSLIPSTTTLRVDDGGVQLTDVHVPFWSTCNMETSFELALGGIISAQAKWQANNRIALTIHNGTQYRLSQAQVCLMQQSYPLGDLPPNTTTHLIIAAPTLNLLGSITTANTIPVQAPYAVKNTPQKRILLDALAALLSGTSGTSTNLFPFGGMPNTLTDDGSGQATLLLLGWLDVPVVPVQIDGHNMPGDEATLLCVHLPAPSNAPNNFPGVSPFAQQPVLTIPSIRQRPTSTTPSIKGP